MFIKRFILVTLYDNAGFQVEGTFSTFKAAVREAKKIQGLNNKRFPRNVIPESYIYRLCSDYTPLIAN